ncbi:MAG: hypothetical protein V8T45_06340 [Oscillospiraceae bacterium]
MRINETGIFLVESIIIQPQTAERGHAHIGQKDVSPGQQAVESINTFRCFKIYGGESLPAVLYSEERVLAALANDLLPFSRKPHLVSIKSFDFNYLRSIGAQHASGRGGCHDGCKFNYLEPGEGHPGCICHCYLSV